MARMIIEYWIGKDVEGGGRDLFGHLPGRPAEKHGKFQSGARSPDNEIWTRHFVNTKPEYELLDRLILHEN